MDGALVGLIELLHRCRDALVGSPANDQLVEQIDRALQEVDAIMQILVDKED